MASQPHLSSDTPNQDAQNTNSSDVPRFLRIPSYAQAHLKITQECIPLLPTDATLTNQADTYAVRLRDSFQSVEAAFVNERGYIQRAIQYSTGGAIIQCPGRDPLLLLWGIGPVRRTDLAHIQYIPQPTKQLSVDFEVEPPQRFYAVQPLTDEDKVRVQALRDATVYRFKNYTAITEASAKQLLPQTKTMMPLDAILTSKFADRMITVQLNKTNCSSELPQAFPEAVGKQIKGIYLLSKAAARILFASAEKMQASLDSILQIPIVSGIITGTMTFQASASRKTQLAQNKLERTATKQADRQLHQEARLRQVVIRQLDGMPIVPGTAEKIAKFLALTNPRMEEGALIGETNEAAQLHETCLGGKWLVGCRAFV